MEGQKKPGARGSTIIAACWLCNGTARMVCMTCRNAWCEDHLHEPIKCVHNRKGHDELRLVLKSGWVEVDDVTFFS